MKKYLLQTLRHDDTGSGQPSVTLATAQQIIEAYGFADCSGDEHAVFDISVFDRAERLTHVPAVTAPFNNHKFVNSEGEVIFDGFSTEH